MKWLLCNGTFGAGQVGCIPAQSNAPLVTHKCNAHLLLSIVSLTSRLIRHIDQTCDDTPHSDPILH